MNLLERLRRLDDRVLGPARPGPAWPRFAAGAGVLTGVGLRTVLSAREEQVGLGEVLGWLLVVAGLGWLGVITRAAFRRRVASFGLDAVGVVWLLGGGYGLLDSREARTLPFVLLPGLLVAVGLVLVVAGRRRRARPGDAPPEAT